MRIAYAGVKRDGETAFFQETGGITWYPGTVREVPNGIAPRLLQHPDVFRRAREDELEAAGAPLEERTVLVPSTGLPPALVGPTRAHLDADLAKLPGSHTDADYVVGGMRHFYGNLFTDDDEATVRAVVVIKTGGWDASRIVVATGDTLEGGDSATGTQVNEDAGAGLTLAPGSKVETRDLTEGLDVDALRGLVRERELGGLIPGFNNMKLENLRPKLQQLLGVQVLGVAAQQPSAPTGK